MFQLSVEKQSSHTGKHTYRKTLTSS